MSTYRVLVSCPLIHDAIDDYAEEFAARDIDYDVVTVDQQLDDDELLDLINGYHGIIAGDDELTATVFEAADDLQVVSKWGIGTDNIDFDAAEENGVEVYNTPGAFADEVADVVFGYVVMLTRDLHLVDAGVRQGEWPTPRGVSLSSRTFGVVGVGNIGSAVARRVAAHGMDVLGHDIRPLPEDLRADIDIEAVDRDELFERSDIVSVNCALTPETRGMVGPTEFEALGSDGYFVNTCRGEVVQQDALVEALRRERIAGAALDVFEDEPLPADDPLTEFEEVILGSHNAQNTEEAVARTNDRAVANLIDGLE